MSVISLDPTLERVLLQAVGGGDAGAIEPALAETLSAKAKACADEQEGRRLCPPCCSCPRPCVCCCRDFLRRAAPTLRVLSHVEVPDSKGIRVTAVLGAR
jgi:flagellar biosynthesis protein FlhA